MKCLNRNKVTFYYAKFERTKEAYDRYGNYLGDTKVVYGNPIKCKANISSAKGEIETRIFGDDVAYDKTIVLDKNPGIDEYSILWVDELPKLKEDGSTSTPHDYIVRVVAKSLNSVTLAIKKVNVSTS